MKRLDKSRWLPGFAVFAVLIAQSPTPFAEAPAQMPAIATQNQSIAPQAAPTPEEVGDTLMSHQRYQAAIEAYKRAPTDSAVVWNKMGIAYQMLYNVDDATRCYKESLRIDPGNANVLNNLGSVYSSLKQYGAAERMYRKALKFNPHSALINKNLGTDLLAEHKYKQGLRSYQAALAIDPHILEPGTGPRTQSPATLQDRGAMNYYMAVGCVLAGMNEAAVEYLRMAVDEGYINLKKVAADNQFAGLRGIPAFEQLLAMAPRATP